MTMRLPVLGGWVRLFAFGMLAALPLSVAAVNVFGSLVVVTALLSQEWWKAVRGVLQQPLAWVVLIMLFLLGAGMLYTVDSGYEAASTVARYRKLLFILLLPPFFQENRDRLRALQVLAVSICFTALLSWTEFFGWTHVSDPVYGGPPGDAVFKMHIPQGTLFSLLVVLGLCLAWDAWRESRWRAAAWGLMALLAAGDIAWVMAGRTGKAILPVIVIWAIWEMAHQTPVRKNFRRLLLAGSVLLVVGVTAAVWLNPHTTLGSISSEIRQSRETGAATSQGMRLAFYRKAMQLMAQRPWFGYGTGSVKVATQELAAGGSTEVDRLATVNVHNEFLMWAVQWGWPGLSCILLFFFYLWQASYRLPRVIGRCLRGQWVVFVAGCLFNSYLLDFAEGYALVLNAGILLPL